MPKKPEKQRDKQRDKQRGRNGGTLLAGGKKGNKGGSGRPPNEHRLKCQEYTDDVIAGWVEILNDRKAPHAARLKAGELLMDRGWGKAAHPITGEDGGPIPIEIYINGRKTS